MDMKIRVPRRPSNTPAGASSERCGRRTRPQKAPHSSQICLRASRNIGAPRRARQDTTIERAVSFVDPTRGSSQDERKSPARSAKRARERTPVVRARVPDSTALLDKQAATALSAVILSAQDPLHYPSSCMRMRAAELAPRALRDPEDQRRFMAQVRSALADNIERGEPLQPVRLRARGAESGEGPRIPQSRVTRRESRLR